MAPEYCPYQVFVVYAKYRDRKITSKRSKNMYQR